MDSLSEEKLACVVGRRNSNEHVEAVGSLLHSEDSLNEILG